MGMYESYSDFSGYIEAIDVDSGVFEAFDSIGRPLDLFTRGGPKAYERPIVVEVRQGVPPEVRALEERSRGCVRDLEPARAGMPHFETDSLPDLIAGLMSWYKEPR